MNMTNIEKHNYCVGLFSDFLKNHDIDHNLIGRNSISDLTIIDTGIQIKIFSNFSRSLNIKVSNDFKTHNGVRYIIMTPTNKNNVGFTCVSGLKDDIDQAIVLFKTPKSPKNIKTTSLKQIGIRRLLKH